MKLYYAPASSYSQRVLIALYEKQINFDPVEVNLFDAQERDRYRQTNPFIKVPTLVTDESQVIFEASIIIEYLDRIQPDPQLIPKEPDQALETRIIERLIDVYINSGREVLFANTQRPDQEQREVIKAHRLLETACQLLDQRLENRLWLTGDTFSLADCAAAPTLAYLRWVYSYSHFPRLSDYVKRLESRPSVARAFQEGREQMMQMLASLRFPLELVL
ncbi:MAG: glutathione S-transferase family protein [Myxacorys chilensis ATA2-1-KO14]|jgi:glutathione S-transferase|nr:glutathione S-transferase family protein [Myxacorys chilensis ATA2-1-KO14]